MTNFSTAKSHLGRLGTLLGFPENLFLLVGVLVPLALIFQAQIIRVREIADGLSIDSYSEADAVRSARGYFEKGFWSNYGLPLVGYGEDFPGVGQFQNPDTAAYTHYPPGPNILLGIYWRLLGEPKLGRFRIYNLLIFFSATAFLLASLSRILSCVELVFFTTTLCLIPSFSNVSHGLHYHGTIFHLLLISIGLTVLALERGELSWLLRGGFLTLGILQGFFSFDFCFLATFCPIPIWLIFRHRTKLPARELAIAVFLSGTGFVLAHIVHLLQVILYHGSISAALRDLSASAEHRFTGTLKSSYIGGLQYVIPTYLGQLFLDERYLGSKGWIIIGLASLCFVTSSVTVRFWKQAGFDLRFTRDTRIGLLVGFIVSMGWPLIMPAHAMVHTHFIPRQMYFNALCVLLAVAASQVRSGDNYSARINAPILGRWIGLFVLILPFLVSLFIAPSVWPSE